MQDMGLYCGHDKAKDSAGREAEDGNKKLKEV